MKIVEVIWNDAHVNLDEASVKEAAKIEPVRTRTVAYLLAENDEGLVLATDTYEAASYKDRGTIINFIPWEMVVEYYIFYYARGTKH